ncbi:MAG: hypothetical protein ACWGQW_18595 [bacterium]
MKEGAKKSAYGLFEKQPSGNWVRIYPFLFGHQSYMKRVCARAITAGCEIRDLGHSVIQEYREWKRTRVVVI